VGFEFLAFNVLLHIKSVKNRFLNKKYTFTICVERVWIVVVYFLFEKQTFNGIQNLSVIISIEKIYITFIIKLTTKDFTCIRVFENLSIEKDIFYKE
jgi:hypothetical protein